MSSEKFDNSSAEFLFGKWLASPPPGEEVVISGLSGKFPKSANVLKFAENLFSKTDVLSSTRKRWKLEDPSLPSRIGIVDEIDVLDTGYLDIHPKHATIMCPCYRMLLEKATEAIFDAGLHPRELEGTKTNVYVCASFCDHNPSFNELRDNNPYGARRQCRTFAAHTISYVLKLNGTSFHMDSACSSSLAAVEDAYRCIRLGQCENAIVAGTLMLLDPHFICGFAKLGVLSPEGILRAMDEDGNGYVRSESAVAVVLQKAKHARRIYSEIVHCKVNQDGFKEDGISHPSHESQAALCKELYRECEIDPAKVSYVEAHATGTRVGDLTELTSINEVFCCKRDKPLLVGSVKSNMGHTEAASGLVSISKVIVGMKYGYIPPNINFRRLRKDIESIAKGKIQVVTEKIPWQEERPLVGISNFGFGGSNAHVLLRGYKKKGANSHIDDLPRLVCVSGRTRKAVTLLLDEIKNNKLNYEFFGFINQIFKYDLLTHRFRGFSIVCKTGIEKESVNFLNTLNRKLVLYFDNFDEEWLTYGKNLLAVPLFSDTIQRIHNTLSAKGMNIKKCIANYEKCNQESLLTVFLASFSVQLAIADMLKSLKVASDSVLGISTGDLIANYFNNKLTLEQVILIAYSYGNFLVLSKSDNERIGMNSGKPKAKINQRASKAMNGPENCYTNDVNNIQNPFEFNAYLEAAVIHFVVQLQEILSSVKSKEELLEEGKQITAESIVQNLLNTKTTKVENFDSVILEIGFGTLDICRDEYERFSHIHFKSASNKNGVDVFSEVLGNLYLAGHNYSIEKLYPKMTFPVSNNVPMVSPLIAWNHSKKLRKPLYRRAEAKARQEKIINIEENEWSFLKGRIIDGHNIFPEAGYLYLVWEAVSTVNNSKMFSTTVTFEDVKFVRATNIPENEELQFTIMIHQGASRFELFEGDNLIVSGKVSLATENEMEISVANELELEMKENDIYKELRLRGYSYSDLFRSMRQCNLDVTLGAVQWQNNWIAFLDNLLQMKILQKGTRNLYVPTRLRKLTINPVNHVKFLKEYEQQNPIIPISVNPHTLDMRCSFIQLEGLDTSAISKRKPLVQPLLEKYVFIPNEADLTLQESIRVNVQIALENNWSVDIEVYELIDDESKEVPEPLSPLIMAALEDHPSVRPTITILTKRQINITNISVENRNLESDMNCFLVVATNLSQRKQLFEQSLRIAKDGFVLSRETPDFKPTTTFHEAKILTVHSTGKEKIVLLHKAPQTIEMPFLKVTNTFEWLSKLKSLYSQETDIILYAQDEPANGILGLTNCIRREPYGKRTKCVFIDDDTTPKFLPALDFYQKQIEKGLAINIYKNGTWGTYRHLLLDDLELVESENIYVNVKNPGELFSLGCFEGPLNDDDVEADTTIIKIYYVPLNFFDQLYSDLAESIRIGQDSNVGFEFVGKDLKGRRVMGITTAGAMANLAVVNNAFIYPIPENWSMEEASTVVASYTTVLYALLKRVLVKRGKSILIHSGTSGVGQAAINVCLHFGLKIFTTAGTQEKREFIRKQYPQIADNQIGNSNDTSFEQMVLKKTKGRGVYYVLNSLSEEKLLASVRCVAKGGHFIELGKSDMVNDGSLRIELLSKGASLHIVMVDTIFGNHPSLQIVCRDLLMRGIKEGYVRPLNRTVFEANQAENALACMSSEKHIGEVVLRIRNEDDSTRSFNSTPRYFCNSNHVYVITGGSGGFGLELADWLVLRGARKLVLSSRVGIKIGYQAFRKKLWESYGVEVEISTANISTKEGCIQLIKEANEMGPVQGIFNLAGVLMDAILENQTEESFATSCAPKAWAVTYLDEVSRLECPLLKDFVVFSSVVCGRGNAGQTNYGMANSVTERICERRHMVGFPALAIQWGPVGDIGVVAETQDKILEVGGIHRQSIASCLSVLDTLLRQKTPIVSSIVVAEKNSHSSSSDNIVQVIANVIGIRDLKMVSPHTPLPELGMDSIMSAEIKRIIERDCRVVLPAAELKSLTFCRLQELFKEKPEVHGTSVAPKMTDFEVLMKGVGSESLAILATVELSSAVEDDGHSEVVILLPGIEGTAKILRKLAKGLKFKTISLQYSGKAHQYDIIKLAESLLPQILSIVRRDQPFRLIAHSFGTLLAIHLINLLEAEGLRGKAILIDGSPVLQKALMLGLYNFESDATFETDLLCSFMTMGDAMALKDKLLEAHSSKERVETAFLTVSSNLLSSKEFFIHTLIEIFDRIRAVLAYTPKDIKIRSSVTLCRPKVVMVADIAEDYHLSEILGQTVPVQHFDGDHLTILENPHLCDLANKLFSS